MTDAEGTRKLSQPINMTWRQELAAFWSILWPCWVLSVLFAAVLSRITAPTMTSAIRITQTFIVLFGQGFLLFRLARKKYRTFWIGVLHQGEPLKQNLSFFEQSRVWLQLLWPQVAFQVIFALFTFWITDWVSGQTLRSVNSLSQPFYILVVGPAAIRWAMYANYRGFRLQAYRRNE